MKNRPALFPAAVRALVRAAVVLAILALGGCLLTLGGPLVRKVEPGRLVIEAGGGPVMGGGTSTFGGAGYAYIGRPLGKHFEIGILPAVAAFGGSTETAWSITLPVRWDPFPADWPAHLIVFAGPALNVVEGTFGTILAGTGVSWTATKRLEAYAALSVPLSADSTTLTAFTASAGARWMVSPDLQLGAGLTLTYPGLATAMVGMTIRTQPPLSGYSF